MRSVLVLLALVAACIVVVSGQVGVGGDIIPSAPDVSTSSLFPLYAQKNLPLGQPIEILLNFKNSGRKTYNVTAIRGFFLDPHDHNAFIQNFTAFRYDQLAPAGYEISFSYLFLPDEMLEVRDYMFYGDVYYTDESGNQYFTPYHNSTVSVYDASSAVDPQYLLTYALLIGMIAGIAYLVTKVLGGKKVKRSKSTAGPSTPSQVDHRDFLADSNLKSWSKKNK